MHVFPKKELWIKEDFFHLLKQYVLFLFSIGLCPIDFCINKEGFYRVAINALLFSVDFI